MFLYKSMKMCTKNGEQTNSSTSIKNADLKVTENTQNVKCRPSNLNSKTNESSSLDFRIQTNIEFLTHKKMKICLLINLLISAVCITVSFVMAYKIYNQLVQVQNEMVTLNAKIRSLSEKYDKIRYEEENLLMDETLAETQVIQKQDSDLGLGNNDGNYELMLRNSRLRRANRRPKEKTPPRKVKSSGTLAAHFKGSVPEIFVKDQGLVGPWYLDNSVSRQYKFPKFHLTEGQCSIEVTEPALYLIYAQVYYVTSNPLNSYSVYVRSEGSSENNIIAKCSTMGPYQNPRGHLHAAEISCYTSTVYSLKANDRVFIQQTEKNRTIILRDGHSFFGLVRLNNSHRNHKIVKT